MRYIITSPINQVIRFAGAMGQLKLHWHNITNHEVKLQKSKIMWIIFALAGALLAGIAVVLSKAGMKNMDPTLAFAKYAQTDGQGHTWKWDVVLTNGYNPSSITWLSKVPQSDKHAMEANFFLGLAAYYSGSLDRAAEAFRAVADRMPLTEVYNNLGVVEGRRSKNAASDYFKKAVEADPTDPDYHFNLGVALYRAGDSTAAKQLEECLHERPQDTEAKALLETINARSSDVDASASARAP